MHHGSQNQITFLEGPMILRALGYPKKGFEFTVLFVKEGAGHLRNWGGFSEKPLDSLIM